MAEMTNEQRLSSEVQTQSDIIEEMGNAIAQLTKEKAYANSTIKSLSNYVNRLEQQVWALSEENKKMGNVKKNGPIGVKSQSKKKENAKESENKTENKGVVN